MAELAHDAKVIGFKEVNHLPSFICTELNPEVTPQDTQLIQRDIIIIQKVVESSQCEYPTVKNLFDYVQHSKTVTFRPLKNPNDEAFELDLLTTMSYDQVTSKLAKHLRVCDPKRLRLTQHNICAQKPHKHPIKYNGVESMGQMILDAGQDTDILYYEVLGVQLPYSESSKCLIIGFHDSRGSLQSYHQIRLPKSYRASDLVLALKEELGEEYNDCDLRVMMMSFSKVVKVLDGKSLLQKLHESLYTFRAEVIPNDQKHLKSDEYLVLFCHCELNDKKLSAFGDPLCVKVNTGETVKEVKVRIQKTLEISNGEFSQWQCVYHVHPMRPPEYMGDEDEILAKFPNSWMTGTVNGKIVGDNTSFIALVHEDIELNH